MDSDIIVISDEELEESFLADNINENSSDSIDEDFEEKPTPNNDSINTGVIIISDEENYFDPLYEVSTPEGSVSSNDEDSVNHQSESSEEVFANKEESSSTDEYSHETNTLKRKAGLKTEELNIEQKQKKLVSKAETQNITTVHEMINQCKKVITSPSKINPLVEKEECSKDVNDESLQEIDTEKNVKLSINENTSNDVGSNSDSHNLVK